MKSQNLDSGPVLGQLRQLKENWQGDPLEAMACRDFEEWLKLCVEVFERIGRFDESWRSDVLQGKTEYSAGADVLIRDFYGDWRDSCRRFEAQAAKFVETYGRVENLEEFNACWREVNGILTDDQEFFSDERLVEARDNTIDERRGESTTRSG